VGFEIEYNDLKEVKVEVEEKHLEGTSGLAPLLRNFIRPFDLSQAPLLRVGLIRLPHTPSAPGGRPSQEGKENRYFLMVDMHHIISDGISTELLIQDFMSLYSEEELPVMRLRYKDFSEWQNSEPQREAQIKQKAYWKKQLQGEIPVLDLPSDYIRPTIQRFEGSSIPFAIDQEEVTALRSLALAEGVTLYMILLGIYYILLSKLGNQEDILVGTTTAGRRHEDLQQIIGMFVNTLVLRNYPSGDKTYRRFLKEIKKSSLKAFENQDFPYEELVEEVEITRDASRNPLFDTMFVMQNMGIPRLEIPGLKLTLYENTTETSKFDLTLIGWEAEDILLFLFVYSTRLFKKDTIERFVTYLKKVVSSLAANPDVNICDVEILTQKEKKEILYTFNNTEVKYPKDITIQRLFEEQVEQTPDHIALLEENSKFEIRNPKQKVPLGQIKAFGEIQLTYNALNERANQLGQLLRRKGITRETITAIMIDPLLEMMIGILAVLKAGGAYLPIDPQQQAGRVNYMLKDSRAVLLLTQRHLANSTGFSIPSLAIDRAAVYKGERNNPERKSNPADVVYTIYTSGTTGNSKGTLIENKNLVNYVKWFKEKVHLTLRDRTVLTSSFSFDLGYTAIFPSILTGCQLHIIPRETYLSPEDLISYINQHSISYLKVTPSLFTTIVENSRFSQTACHILRLVVLGGEEIKLKDVEKAHRIAGHLYFMNHYGPTEATIGCVAQFIDFDRFADYKKQPTIGAPIDNMRTVILDNRLMLLPVSVAGELCVSGASVARGYLNQPELTAEKFDHDLWDYLDYHDKKKVSDKKIYSHRSYRSYKSHIYRTGDKARWLTGGMIEFLGRIDTQVKIRGYRIEPGEIESHILAHEAVNEAVIIPRELPSGDKYLCAYTVLKNPGSLNIPALKEYLAVELPDYMIPPFFVELERIPLTPNGKLNRKLLPEPEIGVLTANFEAPRNPMEKRLAEEWKEILEVDRIGIDGHFFQLGGHSLKAIILISRLNKAFHVNVPLMEIFRTPTIRGLSAYIKSKKEGLFTSIEPVEEKDYHALSSAQKRLYILHQMDEDSTSYNMPYALRLEGEVNKNELEVIFLGLIARHESLRTSFRMLDGVPVQRIHDNIEFEIEYYQVEVKVEEEEGTRGLPPLSGETAARGSQIETAPISSFIRPFDLSRPPLLRVGLVRQEEQEYLLMVDMHHIISDGISRRLLAKEFMALTAGKNLPPLRLQYKDFSEWQNQEAQREAQIKQKAYWKKQLQGEIPVLDLPCDYSRPTMQRFEGSAVPFAIDQEEVKALRSLALAEGMTLYMILLAIYYILLTKLSNQEDILVGTPTAGRHHADLQQIIGMFVNTLVLRNYPSGDKTYIELLREVKERSLQAFENQDYPYEELVEKVAITRDTSRNPLFDTMFVVQNMEIPKLEIPGLKLTLHEHPFDNSKFDITLIGWEAEKKLLFIFEYSTLLFKKETIERFVTYLKKVISSVAANPGIKICDVEILREEEKREIIYDFNNATSDCPKNKGIPGLFEEQVGNNPDSIAVIGPAESAKGRRERWLGGHEISYKELNEKSNQLAYGLRSKGVAPDTIVGIMAERSLEMIIGILGILKSGGAYLPIDLEYPKERIQYMLKDSSAKILVTAPGLSEKFEKLLSVNCQLLMVNEIPTHHLHLPPLWPTSFTPPVPPADPKVY
jgi:amino acid adenylation domain-containing protein